MFVKTYNINKYHKQITRLALAQPIVSAFDTVNRKVCPPHNIYEKSILYII
jgi:hypothetical protein